MQKTANPRRPQRNKKDVQKRKRSEKKVHTKLNGWPFYQLRRQAEYKSEWYNGISIIKPKPNKTSSKCSICGGTVSPKSADRLDVQFTVMQRTAISMLHETSCTRVFL